MEQVANRESFTPGTPRAELWRKVKFGLDTLPDVSFLFTCKQWIPHNYVACYTAPLEPVYTTSYKPTHYYDMRMVMNPL